MKAVYQTGRNKAGFFYAEGPNTSWYGHTLSPELSADTEEIANKMTAMANLAYKEGYAQAQRDIRVAIGITKK